MEITPKELIYIISLGSLTFLIAPFFLIIYVLSYNDKKRKIHIEQERLQMNFEKELLKVRMEVREQTMQTIGADLHDNIGQLLSLTSLTLASVKGSNQVTTERKIATAKELVSKSIDEVRQLGKLIQGDQLVRSGLPNAIMFELDRVEKSGMFETTLVQKGFLNIKSHDKDLIAFRLFQEALSNIVKHSRGNAIHVQLLQKDQWLTLEIYDNGQGFDMLGTRNHSDGMGLLSMERRAAIVGGKVLLNSSPGNGTEISITIPYP